MPFERASRSTSLAPGEGLPGRVWSSREPAWIADIAADVNFPRRRATARAGLHTAFCFPIRGAGEVLGAMEFLARDRREPDAELLETMASLGARIGQCVEQWRVQERLRESDARKSAILDSAFDSIITMDAGGRIVEVNQAAEHTFGYTAEQMVGRDLADLIIPPSLREPHRRGLRRYVATGEASMLGHPVELPAMRADGTEFPVEIAITRPLVAGPPQFTGYLRDITERKHDEQALRVLAEEQAALRRVATVVASEADPERVFAVVTEEVGHLLHAHTSNMCRFEPDGTGMVVGAWSTGGVQAVPVGTHVALDGTTVAALIRHSGRPERVDTYEGIGGTTAELLRSLGFRSAVGAPVQLTGRLWGAMIVSTVEERRFADGAEQRIADFAELVALALGNAEAREALAASRARIVEVGDAERRRLERNLHDGAQQQLVTLALTLRLAEAKLSRGDPEAPVLLRRASGELNDALEELRELARGIHPAVLTDRGLVPALETLCGRAGVPVEMSAVARRPAAGRRRGRRLLHRRRGADQRLQARRARRAWRCASAGWTAARWSRWPTTASAAPTCATGRACADSATASRRSAARWSSKAPRAPARRCAPASPAGSRYRVAWRSGAGRGVARGVAVVEHERVAVRV